MRAHLLSAVTMTLAACLPASIAPAQEGSAMSDQQYDSRAAVVRHLDIHYPPPPARTLPQWEERAKRLRAQVLAAAGLVPMPQRPPLRVQFLGRALDAEDYTVDKVLLETMPGFFLGGNLYRPKGKKGPFPGIANPHGHWAHGRIENSELGSIPARCITFARMGCVAFAYDMVGYNDTRQVPHTYGGEREALWGISLGGLQLWNSIRVLDFLASLPDVDPKRLACTGASGGGTQTFLLCAVDDRVRVAAPVNMISLLMQGGCLCENLPNLRVDTTNVEIGALMAPRPLLMVSATGDWTRNTLEEEYPAVRSVYALMHAEEKVHAVRITAPHNYNRQSREAVYAWFAKWLLGLKEAPKEQPITLEHPEELLDFAKGEGPKGALDADGLTKSLIARSEAQLKVLWPRDRNTLRAFRDAYLPALSLSLGVQAPAKVVAAPAGEAREQKGIRAERLFLGRPGVGDRVPALLLTRTDTPRRGTGAVVVHPDGIRALYDEQSGQAQPLVEGLLRAGKSVLLVDTFLTGDSKAPASRADDLKKYKYFSTYNHTDVGNRVQDILTALAYLRSRPEVTRVRLAGAGEAGVWGLLACPLDGKVEAAALDLAEFDVDDDSAYLHRLNVPCLRRAGDLRAAAALSAPTRLLLHHALATFPTDRVAGAYRAAGMRDRLQVRTAAAADAEVVAWLK